MSEEAILEGIAEVAWVHLGWEEELTPEMRLVEDLRLDSVRLLTLAMEVENRFRVRLDELDEGSIETVGDLVAAVRRRLGD
jgi:acyl carrier protein